MSNRNKSKRQSRRAAVVVLAAFLMVVMLGVIALAVDVGYMLTVRTQLQVAADSAALAAGSQMGGTRANLVATAQQFARYHKASGSTVDVSSSDVEYGLWDSNSRSFTPTGMVGNAVRVTTRRNNTTGSNRTFFGRIFGVNTFNAHASAVAMGNPRDICFVVDLSGSMNDDTQPGWGNGSFSGQYASIRTQMMQAVYSDLNFGSYPGSSQQIGQPLGANELSDLTSSSSSNPLRSSSIPTTYRIRSADSASTRQTKAYRWIIDNQIASLMPNARPAPQSSNSTSFNYWRQYIDEVEDNNSRIGYKSYTEYMMYYGRDQRPDGSNYTQLSVSSPHCRYHNEATAGGTFSFPAREQPTHACRRSVIAALQEVKEKNQLIGDPSQRDWVSIVTFDTVGGTRVHYSLNSNYDAAMQACTTMQAVGNGQSSTATETGLIFARNHIKALNEGGNGRNHAQKVVVLLTDGMANLKSSSNSQVSNYRQANSSSNFYGGSNTTAMAGDAALMQTHMMQGNHWQVFGIGIGLEADFDFMDRIARMGSTANDAGRSPHTSRNPSEYENELTAIFQQIVQSPQVHLVQ